MLGFDKDGQFVPQHMRGPDVTLFRGKSGGVLLSFLFSFSKGTQVTLNKWMILYGLY